MDNLFLTAVLFCSLLSVICAILGCFMVWSKTSFLGDSLSHGAILGCVLSKIIYFLPPEVCIFFVSLICAFSSKDNYQIFSYGSLSVASLIAHLFGINLSLFFSMLFGDILGVSTSDILLLMVIASFVAGNMFFIGKQMIFISLNPVLASVYGTPVKFIDKFFLINLCLVITVGFRTVGSLVCMSLLLIPPAIAGNKSPKFMLITSSIAGALFSFVGISASFAFDLPTGPSIVSSGILFLIVKKVFARI
jgi:zinc transport system permease protein